ncbi:MAG: hypothetical protein ACREHG_05450 [Candidatus Saccharimonadales bacterium]
MASTADVLMLKYLFKIFAFFSVSAVTVVLLCSCARPETEGTYGKNLDYAFYRPTTNVQYPVNYATPVVQITLDKITLGAVIWPYGKGVWLNICLTLPKYSSFKANWNSLQVVEAKEFSGEFERTHILRRRLLRLNLNQPVYATLFPPPGPAGRPTGLLHQAEFMWRSGEPHASFTLVPWPQKLVTLEHTASPESGIYQLEFFLTPPPKRVVIRIPNMAVNGHEIHSFLITFKWIPGNPSASVFGLGL